MNRLRFVMVGGFLGAGKTTTLARLARFYMGRGQKVGLVTNRIDEMDPAALSELTGLVQSAYPGTPVLRLSAKTGQGFDALMALLDQEGNFGRKILDIDYDVYAEARRNWDGSTAASA